MTAYLSYWVPATARRELDSGGALRHAASEQFGKVEPGDVVFIVTVWPSGHLVLLGAIPVGTRSGAREAAAALGVADTDLWEASWHIVADASDCGPIRELDITDLAPSLRFLSKRDRLTVTSGRVSAQQLQAIRKLSPVSASLLARRLETANATDRRFAAALGSGQGFGRAADNRKVEKRAVAVATQYYRRAGWKVVSHERLNRGYDLYCTLGDEIRRVEVKGTRGDAPTFIITENELSATDGRDWVLALVTQALGRRPELFLIPGSHIDGYFELRPIASRGSPTRSLQRWRKRRST